MDPQPIFSDYFAAAMREAVFSELEDASWVGRVPRCKGLLAFGSSRAACEAELRSTLEEWVLLGLRLGHPLPVIGGIDLSATSVVVPVEAA